MTTLIDVNERFDTERAGQLQTQLDRAASFEQRIKDGKMVDIGGGRYQVREPGSWDNGEIFYLNSEGLALPQHGLYELDGKVALYSAQPEWHSLGSIIPGGTTLISEVLKAGGVDFKVRQAQATYKAGRKTLPVPGQFVNYRDDTLEPFGIVGKIYEPLQPRQSFEFLQDLTGNYGLTWESAGLTAKGKLFVCVKLPEDIELDIPGLEGTDTVRPYIVVFDSWDGNSKFQAKVTPWRVRCGNTERFATRDAVSSWGVRHTTNAAQRIEEAQKTLGLSLKYMEAFKAEEELLARVEIQNDHFRELMADLWPEELPREEQTTRTRLTNERREEVLEGMWGAQKRETGSTAYSAERVVTDWLDHVAPRRVADSDKLAAAKATAVLEGADDDLKSRAHRRLLTLTNR